ncbi:Thylakoid lumenal kDa chloroplastic [Chlorella sorokiniana]|uniref:Thylakoid lumenal kDa chloroplastic n=1 Tax=Chlorella sorokiniana TaxID=3076 RepID=A0A2P6TNZ5_CHLSO|nr:Thylakoid lumenal kDa chloroplastic [Chlorella sorokiniana]|eukprot:PRW51057.1 Thylakoid lumenal kDa chloroplastic [Chlorella sorokiniana]
MQTCLSAQQRPFVGRQTASRSGRRLVINAAAVQRAEEAPQRQAAGLLLSLAASAALVLGAGPAAAEVKLPPLDTDPNRCERAYVGNTIGQANAVSDKVLDLRFCKLSGANLRGKTLSGALIAGADLSGANLQEAVFTKAYAVGANLKGADLTNAVVDRMIFDKADLEGAQLVNTVITGTSFEGTNLKDANFEDALIGNEDAKRLCANPTLQGESRLQVGCRN